MAVIDSYSEANYASDFRLPADVGAYTGQAFSVTTTSFLDSAQFYLKKQASATGTIEARVYDMTGTYGTNGKPTGSPLATSGSIDVSTLSTSYGLITFTFTGANNIVLTKLKQYVVVVYANMSYLNTYVGYDGSAPSHSGSICFSTDGATWTTSASYDLCFYVNGTALDAPYFQALGASAAGTAAITPEWPAHQADDIALLFVESNGDQTAALSTAAGFEEVSNSPQYSGADTRLTVFWCRATSGAMSNPVVADPGNHAYGVIVTFRGCKTTGNPINITAGSTETPASTSATAPTVTTTVNNCLIVNAIARQNDSASAAFSSWANANLATIAEVQDEGTALGGGGGTGVAIGELLTAGASGETAATVTSSINASLTIALLPIAAAPLSSIKTINGLAVASVATVNGLAIASVKTWNGLA